ncbi:MAG: hypothetical protein SGILL_007617, partial [Bacillariaceae sp.]
AAVTLAASSSTAVSASSGDEHLVGSSNAAVIDDQQKASSFRQRQVLLKAQAMGDNSNNFRGGRFTHGFAAKYHNLRNGEKRMCVPAKQASSTSEGDFLGVLSCGPREYCAENDASSLGGYCEPKPTTRSLQYGNCIYWTPIDSCVSSDADFCEEAAYACDCAGVTVDPANSTLSYGEIACAVPLYCEADEAGDMGFAPCPNTCWDVELETVFSPNELGLRDYSEVTCTVFSSPYSQTFCRGESDMVVEGVAQLACNMSLDGEFCTSCSVGDFVGTPQTNPNFFDAWNCTNLGLGASPAPELGEFASRFSVQPPLFSASANCSRTDAPVPTDAPSAAGTPATTTLAPVAPVPTETMTPAPSPASSASLRTVSLMAMSAAVGTWLTSAF